MECSICCREVQVASNAPRRPNKSRWRERFFTVGGLGLNENQNRAFVLIYILHLLHFMSEKLDRFEFMWTVHVSSCRYDKLWWRTVE